jgi:Raf kinase inhibitor-like YbhB/YbcL family protein
MKKATVIIIVIIILALAALIVYRNSGGRTTTFNAPSSANTQINTTTPMTISSSAFLDSQAIPKQYTCDGDGINPPLQFNDVPGEAKSLALLVEDPDAPTGTWIHWLMWNIPPAVTEIAQNSVPQGAVQGQGSSGQNVFGAPCPPSGIHHYIFTVYVLDSKLTLPSYSTAENLQSAMQGHIITQAQIIGLYGR